MTSVDLYSTAFPFCPQPVSGNGDTQTLSDVVKIVAQKERKRPGRKPIRRNIMLVYFNALFDSIILPNKVLKAIENPSRIEVLWEEDERRVLFHAAAASVKNTIDIPSSVYENSTGISFDMPDIVEQVKASQDWDDYTYAAECCAVLNNAGEKFILSDLYTAREADAVTEKINFIGHRPEGILLRKGWVAITKDNFVIR